MSTTSAYIHTKVVQVLRWSEQYTKTNISYLFSGLSILGTGQIISSASSLLITVMFANWAPKELFGEYKYILSVVGILMITTLPGMTTAFTKAIAKGQEPLLKEIFFEKFRWGTIGAFLSAAAAGYYFINQNEMLGWSFLISAFFIPFFDALTLYNAYLYGIRDFKKSVLFHFLSQLIGVGGLITTLYFGMPIPILLLSYFASYSLARASILLYFMWRQPKILGTSESSEVSSFGKHLSAMSILSTIEVHIDRVLTFQLLGSAPLALYAIAAAAPEQLRSAVKNISVLALPKFAKRDLETIKNQIARKSFLVFLFTIVCVGVYILCAPYIIELVFPKYTSAISLSQLFSLSIVGVVSILPITALQAHGRTKELYAYNIISSTMSIVLLALGVFFFGLVGMVCARIIHRSFQVVYAHYLLSRIPSSHATS